MPDPAPLTKKQRDALLGSKDNQVHVFGRGCKQSINGLVDRGLVDRARLSFRETGYWGYLTEDGKKFVRKMRRGG